MVGKLLLKPFSALYGGITDVRNRLYDNGFLKSLPHTQFCISVGNLTVGGTGKTPAVEYLIKLLSQFNPAATGALATLSRGYGRATTGFRVASPTDTAATIGDEPLQLYHNLGGLAAVCVGERRAEALAQLANLHPNIGTVVLDDAFQHRAVQPQLQLLLMDYTRPFYTDDPFPGGRLRERRHGAKRADLVLVTKCPHDPTDAEREQMSAQISRYTKPNTPVLFAGLRYDSPKQFISNELIILINRPVYLVTGLANAGPLVQYVTGAFGLLKHVAFGDHHAYARADMDQLLADCPPDTWLLTTQKDEVKLAALLTEADQKRHLAYLPVAMDFWRETDVDTLRQAVLGVYKKR